MQQRRKILHILEEHTKSSVHDVVFNFDGKLLATSSADKIVRLWDVDIGQMIRLLTGHKNSVFGLSFLGDKGRYLASASFDQILRIWDTSSGVTMRVLQGHMAGVTGIATYANQLFISASNDGTVILWDTDLPYQQIVDLPSEPASVAIAPDGNSVAVGFDNGMLCLYSLFDFRLLGEMNAHDLSDSCLLSKISAHDLSIQDLEFATEKMLLVSASHDNIAKLWQIKNGKLHEQQKFIGYKDKNQVKHGLHDIAISPDGHTIATASYSGHIGLFKVGTEQKLFKEVAQEAISSIDFDSDGRQLLSASKNGHIHLWKFDPKQFTLEKNERKFPKSADSIQSVSFSPDNKKIGLST